MSALHDLNRCVAVIMGVRISGYGDGGISISKDGDVVTAQPNADGTGNTYSLDRKRTHVVTVELSPHNATAHRLLDEAYRGFLSDRTITRGFFFRDPATGDQASSRVCVPKTVPNMDRTKEAGFVTWEFYVEPADGAVIRGANL